MTTWLANIPACRITSADDSKYRVDYNVMHSLLILWQLVLTEFCLALRKGWENFNQINLTMSMAIWCWIDWVIVWLIDWVIAWLIAWSTVVIFCLLPATVDLKTGATNNCLVMSGPAPNCHTQVNKRTTRHEDRQTHQDSIFIRQTGLQTNKQTKEANISRYRHAEWQINRLTDRQACRQTDRECHWSASNKTSPHAV